MRELSPSALKETDFGHIKNINKKQIEEKYQGKFKDLLLKIREEYQKKFKEYPRIIDHQNTVTYNIEFREGKYGQLVDYKQVTLNHESELEEKVKLLIWEFMQDEEKNIHDMITWSADEIVVIKNVKSGRYQRYSNPPCGDGTVYSL